MATTATNKQPALVDSVLHEIVDLNGHSISSTDGVTITGNNSAALLIDCTQNDGATIEDIYSIARDLPNDGTTSNPSYDVLKQYVVVMYLSTARDFLRPAEAKYVGSFIAQAGYMNDAGTAWEPNQAGGYVGEGFRWRFADMPRVTAPVARLGSVVASGGDVEPTHYRSLYIPRGRALWGAVQKLSTSDTATTHSPLLGLQGGYY